MTTTKGYMKDIRIQFVPISKDSRKIINVFENMLLDLRNDKDSPKDIGLWAREMLVCSNEITDE